MRVENIPGYTFYNGLGALIPIEDNDAIDYQRTCFMLNDIN